ncbi:MAG TPA: serine hydrolase domain-containing protein [Methylomirabilota bacterium]|nr:serine hydrolase domain-containing protein [Methylomirabilota bacterium]
MRAEGTAQGTCAPGFEPVREIFSAHFAAGLEVGAAVAVVHHGRLVVDLWGGHMDRARTRPWGRDTLVNVYSTTKGLVALLVAMLVDEGKLQYEAPVARYWPAFAARGKDGVTVAMLLSHQAGLCGVDTRLQTCDLYDWSKMVAILEQAAPLWAPGERTGYHARTWGFLVGELIRRVTGRRVGDFLRERLAEPFALDFHVGLPAAEDARAAEIVGPDAFWERQQLARQDARLRERMDTALVDMMGLDVRTGAQAPPPPEVLALMEKVFTNPFNDLEAPNCRAWRAAEIPSSNGHGTARGLARVYGALAAGGELDGRRLLGRDALAAATRLESDRLDGVLGFPVRWARGFTLNGGEFGPSPGAFGHRGIGGSFACADAEAGVGVAYTPNQLVPKFGDNPGNDPRADRLMAALYECL